MGDATTVGAAGRLTAPRCCCGRGRATAPASRAAASRLRLASALLAWAATSGAKATARSPSPSSLSASASAGSVRATGSRQGMPSRLTRRNPWSALVITGLGLIAAHGRGTVLQLAAPRELVASVAGERSALLSSLGNGLITPAAKPGADDGVVSAAYGSGGNGHTRSALTSADRAAHPRLSRQRRSSQRPRLPWAQQHVTRQREFR